MLCKSFFGTRSVILIPFRMHKLRKRRRQRQFRRRLANAVLFQARETVPKTTSLYNLQWMAEICTQYWPKWLQAVDVHRQRLIQVVARDPSLQNIDSLIPVERLYNQMEQVRIINPIHL